jgi:hypothetical protein
MASVLLKKNRLINSWKAAYYLSIIKRRSEGPDRPRMNADRTDERGFLQEEAEERRFGHGKTRMKHGFVFTEVSRGSGGEEH